MPETEVPLAANLLGLLTGVVFGVATAMIASSKNRSPVGWFFAGFFCSCIGPIVIFLLPPVESTGPNRATSEREHQRLQEQMRRAKAKSEAGGGAPAAASTSRWYYEVGGQRAGPVSTNTLSHMLRTQRLPKGTRVCMEGTETWVPGHEVPELTARRG